MLNKFMADYQPPFRENIRTPARWHAINRHYDFRKAYVWDVGCYTGEMSFRAYHAGASKVLGIDRDHTALKVMKETAVHLDMWPRVKTQLTDIAKTHNPVTSYVHAVFMLSCASYMLQDYGAMALQDYIRHHIAYQHAILFFEPHYDGDGPGGWADHYEVFTFLRECGFTDTRRIVSLPVMGRDAVREIYRCSMDDEIFLDKAIGAEARFLGNGRVLLKLTEARTQAHLENAFDKLRTIESRYVPEAIEIGDGYLILSDMGTTEPVTDMHQAIYNAEILLEDLARAQIHHGDLTSRNVIIRDNVPYAIDFFESRYMQEIGTGAKPKRPEPDRYHLMRALGADGL